MTPSSSCWPERSPTPIRHPFEQRQRFTALLFKARHLRIRIELLLPPEQRPLIVAWQQRPIRAEHRFEAAAESLDLHLRQMRQHHADRPSLRRRPPVQLFRVASDSRFRRIPGVCCNTRTHRSELGTRMSGIESPGYNKGFSVENSERTNPIYCAAIFALVALVLLAAGCGKPQAQAVGGMPPVPVSVAVAAEESVPVQIRVIGTVEPSSTVQIKSQVAGELLSVHFTEGRDVNKDDLLFEIDPRPYREALAQAEAAVAKDRAQLAQA